MECLKICFIGKYPPHKGGSASINYWMARTLGSLGHEVHVVTDPIEREENYLKNLDKRAMEAYEPKNVKVHCSEIEDNLPVKSKVSILSNLAVEVVEDNKIDIIDAKYFIPYGIAGFLTKLITKKPLVIRHGGSDITYLLESPLYRSILLKMLNGADKIILDPSKFDYMVKIGIDRGKIECVSDFGMDAGELLPGNSDLLLKRFGMDGKIPVLGCFGKIFVKKGITELLASLSLIKNEDFLLLLAPESNAEQIKKLVFKFGLDEKTKILDYQPPWVMPYLYDCLTALIATEVDFPVKMHTPLTAYESIHFGKCTVISEETHKKPQFSGLMDKTDIVVVEPKNTKEYAKRLQWIIKNADEANKIGLNAKKRRPVEGRSNAESLVKIYKSILNSS